MGDRQEAATTTPYGSVYEEVHALRRLVRIADRMFAEQAAKRQAESDAKYQAEFGHNGPRLAGALGSAGRKYVYERHRLGPKLGLPDAATALGQRGGSGSPSSATPPPNGDQS